MDNEFEKSNNTESHDNEIIAEAISGQNTEEATEEVTEETSEDTSENITEESEAVSQSGKKFLGELFEWLETLAFAFAFVILFFTFIMKVVTVDGSSMYPTLHDGDRLIISDVLYTPVCGDIVVVERANADPIIKRVIATEGQTLDIDFENWVVTVDGEVVDEPYINREHFLAGENMYNYKAYEYPITIGKDCVFVMGDNRNRSMDSRDPQLGQIHESQIIGRVLLRIFPLGKIGAVKPADVDYNN